MPTRIGAERAESAESPECAECVESTGPADLGAPSGQADDRDIDRVLRALARLGPRDREVLLLTAWDGLDQRRAAAALGCSRPALAVRLHRARARLQRALDTIPTSHPRTETP